MSFVSITITVLVLLIMLSLYYNYKFAMIIFRIEDAIEDFETVDFSKIRVNSTSYIPNNLIRLHIGLENIKDLQADLEQAFKEMYLKN